MRDDGPNTAAIGANIGAYAMEKALKPSLDKKSAENIVEIPLTVNGYKGEDGVKKTMYVEKGLCISFADAYGRETTYTIGRDGKIYDSKNRVISSVSMNADQYAVLDAMSKEAKEATDKNVDYDVLTAQDIRDGYDHIHPFHEGQWTRNHKAKDAVRNRVQRAINTVGGKATVSLDAEYGHRDDIDVDKGKFKVDLLSQNYETTSYGHKYHPRIGSVSVFMQDEK